MDNNSLKNVINQGVDLQEAIYQLECSDDDNLSNQIEQLKEDYFNLVRHLDNFHTDELIQESINLLKEYSQFNKLNNSEAKAKRILLHKNDIYWHLVWDMRERGSEIELNHCKRLAQSNNAFERHLSADVLALLAYKDNEKYYDYAVTQLITFLNDNDENVVISAGYALGHRLKNEDNRAVAKLVELAKSPNKEIRESVVQGLSGNESDLAITTLIQLCQDEHFHVKNWATFAIANMTDLDTPQIRETLHSLIDNEDYEIRGEALVGLSSRGDYTILDKLKKELLKEYEADYAVEASKNLADESLLPYLLKIKDKVKDLPSWHLPLLNEAIEACSNPKPHKEN